MGQITVVLALYRPHIHWLEEQLASLAGQTLRDFEVILWNDCPEDGYDYPTLAARILGDIPCAYHRGMKNEGSNKAFERLTALTETPYIAYCDQDDIWLPDKLAVLRQVIEERQVDLACSDAAVINGESQQVADSVSEVRPRQAIPPEGDWAAYLLRRNFVTGCTMLMRTEAARRMMPFSPHMVHDHWLAIGAAMQGGLYAVRRPLIQYRISGSNQTGPLKGITNKEEYFRRKILPYSQAMEDIAGKAEELGVENPRFLPSLKACQAWAGARVAWYREPTAAHFRALHSLRHLDRNTTWFEMLLPGMPESFFHGVLQLIQKGKL